MNIVHLRQQLSLDNEQLKTGKFKGIAYSGSVIKEHGFISNLIIDLKSLSVAKQKTPILRDHNTSFVSGHGKVDITEKEVTIEGTLSKKSIYGSEIISLSEDGTDWEMSLGVYGGTLRPFKKKETINGIEMEEGTVLEGGTIREVSFVILGADMNTSAEVFEVKTNKEESTTMNLNQNENWEKFACACGGNKETTPEELSEKFTAQEEAIKAKEAEIATKHAEIEALKKELEDIKQKSELNDRKESIAMAAKEKGIDLSEEALNAASENEQNKNIFLLALKSIEKQEKKIEEKFTEKVDVGTEPKLSSDDTESIRLAAEKLVQEGKATNFMQAINILEVK